MQGMTTEIDTRRNQIRELGHQIKEGDRSEIEVSLEAPAEYIKEVIKKESRKCENLDVSQQKKFTMEKFKE